MREILETLLTREGYDVRVAASGTEGIEAARSASFDAAIVDLMLPDMDGVAVCAALREWTQMPIIVLSAIDEEDQKVRALEVGADDYVVKPFAPRELVARLEAALRRHASGSTVLLLGDDEALERDLRAHCRGTGHELVRLDRVRGHGAKPVLHALVRKA